MRLRGFNAWDIQTGPFAACIFQTFNFHTGGYLFSIRHYPKEPQMRVIDPCSSWRKWRSFLSSAIATARTAVTAIASALRSLPLLSILALSYAAQRIPATGPTRRPSAKQARPRGKSILSTKLLAVGKARLLFTHFAYTHDGIPRVPGIRQGVDGGNVESTES